jgi:hypothetical protein
MESQDFGPWVQNSVDRQKNYCQRQSKRAFFPAFSSKSFKVSGLTFRSFIHFELSFAYGV